MRDSAPSPFGNSSLHALGAVGALVALLVVSTGCGEAVESAEEVRTEPLPTIEAAVLTVTPQSWPTVVRSQGSLFADEVSVVGAKVAGRVAAVHVDLGDRVVAGDPLVALDQEELQLAVAQAEAQLAQARSSVGLAPGDPVDQLNPENAPPVRQERAVWEEAKTSLERARRLREQEAIAPGEFDQFAVAERVAEARYAAALNGVHEKIALIGVREAELALARQRVRDAVIAAPFDGLVQQRQVAPGMYLAVGDAVAVLVRTDPLRFQGTVPERHAQDLAVGQQVRLRIESIDQPRLVQVTRISPALDQRSRALRFEAEVENHASELRTGLFAEAEVVIDSEAESLVVPHSAVVEFAGAEKVWKIIDGVAGEQEVVLGQRRPGGIEILQGLTRGDQILLDGSGGAIARITPLGDPSEQAGGEPAGGEQAGGIEPVEEAERANRNQVARPKPDDGIARAAGAPASGGP